MLTFGAFTLFFRVVHRELQRFSPDEPNVGFARRYNWGTLERSQMFNPSNGVQHGVSKDSGSSRR